MRTLPKPRGRSRPATSGGTAFLLPFAEPSLRQSSSASFATRSIAPTHPIVCTLTTGQRSAASKYPLAAENYFIRIGFYARHLTRYVEQFGRRGVKICFYDDLERSASRFMRELFSFIGVDPNVVVNTSARFNTLGVRRVEQRFRKHGLGPLSRRLRSLIPEQLYHLVYRGYSAAATGAAALPPMSPEMRERLRDVYAADIAALQVLTGRDLSPWLQA
jgi:hypothetical protein